MFVSVITNFIRFRHGDLNKPPHDARGRILNMKSWVRLTEMLNNDVSGDIKTTDKWKKVCHTVCLSPLVKTMFY